MLKNTLALFFWEHSVFTHTHTLPIKHPVDGVSNKLRPQRCQ